jgi:K+-transporting ATPase KdpF subunit
LAIFHYLQGTKTSYTLSRPPDEDKTLGHSINLPEILRKDKQQFQGVIVDGPCHLASSPVPFGFVKYGLDVRLCVGLRESMKGEAMVVLAAVVTLLLFLYLLAALLRPEWF